MNHDPALPPPEATSSSGLPEKIDLKVKPGQSLRLDTRVNQAGKVEIRSGFRVMLGEITRSGRLFAFLALLLTAVVLFSGITRYPAHVTPDEVYSSLRAVDLLQNNFKGEGGYLLPAFLRGSTPFGVGTGAYLQLLPQFFRPNTLPWIRGLNVLLGLLAALGLTVWLRNALRLAHAWVLMPLLACIPAWFFFTRTGLDITLAASLSMGALGCYGFYRAGRPRLMYGAVVLAMVAFYAAPPARLAVPTAAILLALTDWHYHRENRQLVLRALLLALAMAVPLGIFLVRHPGAIQQELTAAGSFLTHDLQPLMKGGRLALNVLNGFNPFYWFLLDPNTSQQYRMGNHPPLTILLAPFVFWGVTTTLRKILQPAYRLVWIGWLAAAVGAAPFGGRLPELLLAVPFLAITAALGLHEAVRMVQHRWKSMPTWLPDTAVLLGVGSGSLLLLFNALVKSPQWPADYGREGLQYGAPQIYAAAEAYAADIPQRSVLVWPEWSTDPDALRRFFATAAGDRVRLGLLDPFLYRVDPSIDQFAFVIPDDQYQSIQSGGKFEVTAVDIITYPGGSAAFALVELAYTPQADEIMEQEAVRRRALVTEIVRLDGEEVTVRHSVLDIGSPEYLFDGNLDSLIRSTEANPLVVELIFPQPRQIDAILVQLGSEPVTLHVVLNPTGSSPQTFTGHGAATEGMKELRVDFAAGAWVEALRLEVLDETTQEPAHVHLWEIRLWKQ
ncbi:MAG: hypothetical protein ACYCYC_00220 [Bellilinea sp.]